MRAAGCGRAIRRTEKIAFRCAGDLPGHLVRRHPGLQAGARACPETLPVTGVLQADHGTHCAAGAHANRRACAGCGASHARR
ncbi:hypothetical protein, partial [Paracidovorax cattleyae]|uniref:hypothetical protein n=1 Tax=Paracidovorax cattleyae TaxID=80868 RepID=UPI001E4E74F6